MNVNIKGKRVAIVGGAGFIGHNLALKLKELGAEPHIIDSLQVNNLGAFTSGISKLPTDDLYIQFINERLDLIRQNEIPMHIVDVREYQLLSPHLNSIQPDVVVHLAAVAHANRANKDPYHTFDHSMRTLENTLDSVKDTKPHFIYFSSSMVYGNFGEEFVTEKTACEPLGIYAALKYSGEKLVTAYNQVFDLPITIIRPSALYGERCVSRRVGQAFIENACRGLNLTLNGDGSDSLDFTYIQDLVQGIVLCIAKDEAKGEIFNLTYGSARTLMDLANTVLEHFPNVELELKPRDKLMPKRGTLSVDKARTLLGYEPAYPIEVGFLQYIEWYKSLLEKHPEHFGV
ncbi:NAD-dependent epimerase/dehydratase family protein [Kiloniella majae]|uniref:NAD-dependent epimerase/dehydratase family protein n=1 Tax=Kiloniella majae TaxID=1938558 RepID=UPI000A27895B|nr:NAD(P)-dependent oxidoreductase [Kiloniella majae]